MVTDRACKIPGIVVLVNMCHPFTDVHDVPAIYVLSA
jgi:hypothetical protein